MPGGRGKTCITAQKLRSVIRAKGPGCSVVNITFIIRPVEPTDEGVIPPRGVRARGRSEFLDVNRIC